MVGLNIGNFLAVAFGGAVGASMRYAINIYMLKNYSHHIPLATVVVNLLGSFFAGVLFAVFVYTNISNSYKLILMTGLLGSLTTYSAFAIETVLLVKSSWELAVLNIAINLFGSLLLAFIGFKATNILLGN